MACTVAVLGAGGIGRHHANWWCREGAEVVAILGRTPESVQRSAARLKELTGFAGGCYTDLAALLQAARPEIVDICVPAADHATLARQALESGCHVLCEKPLVFDAARTPEALLQEAHDLAALAGARGVRLGLCSQFSVVARTCRELLQARAPGTLRRIAIELRSPARGRAPDPAQTWIDLGPHLIAALQTLLPGGEPGWPAVRAAVEGYEARLDFPVQACGAAPVTVQLAVGFTTGEPANVRRLTLNDTAFDLLGETGPDGCFRMRYRSGTGIDEPHPDPMRLLIREFLAGHPPLGPEAACENQRLLLRLLAAIEQARGEVT
jgi:predicted dehydrogenase